MPLNRALISIQGNSGMSADRFVNTWHFTSQTAVADAEGPAVSEAFHRFYAAPETGDTINSEAVGYYMANQTFAGAENTVCKLYRLEEPKIRVPFYTRTWQTALAPAGSLPGEVACCLTMRAAPVSGVPQGRRRGRVFIGPLATSAMTTAAQPTFQVRPSKAFRDALLMAGTRLATELRTLGMKLVVHSPTTGDLASFEITEFSVDDAFDTIRSRGIAPTIRDTAIVPV